MSATSSSSSSSANAQRLPRAFQRLAWSNLCAQSAEQISLAAASLVKVFALGFVATMKMDFHCDAAWRGC